MTVQELILELLKIDGDVKVVLNVELDGEYGECTEPQLIVDKENRIVSLNGECEYY